MNAQTKGQSFSFSRLDVSKASLKIWLFLASLSLAHLFIGYQLGGRLGLFVGLMLASSFSILLFTYTDDRLLHFFKAKEVLGRDSWKLLERIKPFSRKVGLNQPRLFIVPHQTPFAFSIAHLGRTGSVCLSSALLEKLSEAEVSAVLAQQICKISTLQSLSVGAATSVANTWLGLAQAFDAIPFFRLFFKRPKIFTRLVTPAAWLLVRSFMTDRSFYDNDDEAGSVMEDRAALATALWKVESYCETLPFETLPCTEHLFIVSPGGARRLTEARIRRLAGTYPL